MNESFRTFIAIEVPEDVRSEAGRLQKQLATTGGMVSWVKPQNLHLTVKFLGSVDASRLQIVLPLIRTAVSASHSFDVQFERLGCFPNDRQPRVVWLGLTELPTAFTGLFCSIEEQLAAAGFPKETRAFKPHLTLARIRPSQHINSLMSALKAVTFHSKSFRVQEVIVMKSQLTRSGAIYTPLEKLRLQST